MVFGFQLFKYFLWPLNINYQSIFKKNGQIDYEKLKIVSPLFEKDFDSTIEIGCDF
jgi:hypothetical protein